MFVREIVFERNQLDLKTFLYYYDIGKFCNFILFVQFFVVL